MERKQRIDSIDRVGIVARRMALDRGVCPMPHTIHEWSDLFYFSISGVTNIRTSGLRALRGYPTVPRTVPEPPMGVIIFRVTVP